MAPQTGTTTLWIRRAAFALLATLLLVLPLPGTPVPPAHALGATSIASGLAFPAGFSFLPDGTILYGERFTGEIRHLDPNTDEDTLVWTITNLSTNGEQGLLSVIPHPKYPANPNIFVYATRVVSGSAKNQVIRVRLSAEEVGVGQKVLLTLPANGNHNGGAMSFGRNGNLLHVVVGDVGSPANAQNLAVLTGKVLRMTPAGKAAPGNPFGDRIFSYGHRNMFGVTPDPQTGRIWVTENGPGCNDEVNHLVVGGNFAWGPGQACSAPFTAEDTNRDGPEPRQLPAWLYNPTIAPTGAAFCTGCGLGAANEGQLFFTNWKDGSLRRITLNAGRTGATASDIVYDQAAGLLHITRAPDGQLYFSDADEIFRLTL